MLLLARTWVDRRVRADFFAFVLLTFLLYICIILSKNVNYALR